ncbi:MAG: VWA domain-containing protein [Luteolibacter sp.]
MIALASPWLLCLLPLPIAVILWWPAHREARPSLHVPFLQRLAEITGRQPGKGSTILQGLTIRKFMLLFAWLCAVLALARPQWIEPPVSKTVPMRDLLLAVDLSGSMKTMDFTDANGKTTDRLTAVKHVLDGFLAGRQGDRVGMIFFGSGAFVQCPFTEDTGVCRRLLADAQVNMAGPQTAFGDAIGLAITLFDHSDMKEKVLVVLTDGNDTASQILPPKAASIAQERGIVIHTVSVGDPKAAGEDALDVPTLKSVASNTGGIYSPASDLKQLEEVYQQLDKLETHQAQTISHRPRRDVFHWPLGAAIATSMIYYAVLLLRRIWHPAGHPAGSEVPA